MSETTLDPETQVLEFHLDGRTYCVDIGHVDEIVGREDDLTPLPNSEPHVEGIMDLRGRTTTILDPKRVLGLDGESTGDRIIVFESDAEANRATGWIIDDVSDVSRVEPESVDEAVDGDAVRGIIKRDGGFVIWVEPGVINA